MAWATARHILVATEEECNALKTQIEEGLDFAEAALENSKCPSGRKGGDLGRFSPGQMVREFDQAVFNGDVGVLYGPIKTQFGYHIIRLDDMRRPQPPAFEIVKEQIKQQMQTGQTAEFERYLSDLESKAKIE